MGIDLERRSGQDEILDGALCTNISDAEEVDAGEEDMDLLTTCGDIEENPAANVNEDITKSRDGVDVGSGRVDVLNNGIIDFEPRKGLEFESKEAAYSFYREYARSLGFDITIKASRRSKKSGKFIDVKIVCSRYGSKHDEFEKRWWKMVDKYNLREDTWFQSLYEDRKKWVPAYMRDICLAGLCTTERSDSISSYFDKYINKETTVKEFIDQYKVFLLDRYEEEEKADFETRHKQLTLRSLSPFEKRVNNSSRSLLEPFTHDDLLSIEEENRGSNAAKASKRKKLQKKQKVQSEARVMPVTMQDSSQQMELLNPRVHPSEISYISQQKTQGMDLGSRTSNLDAYHGAQQQGAQGLGQLNSLPLLRDGYYSNQQSMQALLHGQLNFRAPAIQEFFDIQDNLHDMAVEVAMGLVAGCVVRSHFLTTEGVEEAGIGLCTVDPRLVLPVIAVAIL
ncbi:hypothetical protein RJ639_010709 [Escallonia herrerae]|uniref:Protein FAR1-RELATED SEQUENCE n=1 Tax=Escallonia herrerae TaxID=1293975 RepID=A0AA89AR75_9ASTE|nr:hypothetical protein RJ639_010709 [Escallonia herrerae]